MRLIIAGSRYYPDTKREYDNLQTIIQGVDSFCYLYIENESTPYSYIDMIIVGGAPGVDRLGEEFADSFGFAKRIIKPNYDKYGRYVAPKIRNREMAQFASEDWNGGGLVAVWDGKSGGTKHMIEVANELELRVHVEPMI